VSAPDQAPLNSRTMATFTAAHTIYPCDDASPDDESARAKEQLDEAAREDFAVPGTIADAAMVVPRAQRRELR
jgi:hypothetical protein